MAEAKQKSLREDAGRDAIPLTGGAWKAWTKAGQRLKGRFLRLRDGSKGGQIADFDTEEGVVTVSAPQMLADALNGVKAGTMVVIEYQGKKMGKKGLEYGVFEAVALPD